MTGLTFNRRTLLAGAGALLLAPAAQASEVLRLGGGALAYRPASATARTPLLILLHGAGHGPDEMIGRFRALADAHGIVLLGPKSTGPTWDLIGAVRARPAEPEGRVRQARPRLGGDQARIDAALALLARIVATDPARTGLAGFSDGASAALCLGPLRPDLYRAILAFSPGLVMLPPNARGGQPVFVSHGRQDHVLGYDYTVRAIVPELRRHRHAVTFRPFDGDHTIPNDVAAEGVAFFLTATGTPR